MSEFFKKKKHTQFKTRVQKLILFKTKMATIDTLFMAKMAKTTYLLGHTYTSKQLFPERLSYKRGKVYATISKVMIMGFYGCLSEPQGVSAWWKETAQTDRYSFFLVPCC